MLWQSGQLRLLNVRSRSFIGLHRTITFTASAMLE